MESTMIVHLRKEISGEQLAVALGKMSSLMARASQKLNSTVDDHITAYWTITISKVTSSENSPCYCDGDLQLCQDESPHPIPAPMVLSGLSGTKPRVIAYHEFFHLSPNDGENRIDDMATRIAANIKNQIKQLITVE